MSSTDPRPTGAAVVLGGGSGIGRSLSFAFAEAGHPVVVGDISQERLDETVRDLTAAGARVVGVRVDVTDWDSVAAFADAAFDACDRVEYLINGVGIESVGALWEVSPEVWSKVVDINLTGVFHGVRAFLPRMGERPEASHVVNISSVAAITSSPKNGAYAASKHGVQALTECLYVECAEAFPQVSVSVVCPAAVDTNIFADALSEGESASEAAVAELDQMREYLAVHGISSDRAAEMIIEGVRRGDYWITTHPERFQVLANRRAEFLAKQLEPVGNVAAERRPA